MIMFTNRLLLSLVKNGIPVTIFENKEKDRLEAEIHIGSKTGTGRIHEEGGKVFLTTRYEKVDEIESFDDVALIAFAWYNNYKDREPFGQPDPLWLKYFLEKGWVTAHTTTVYK